MSLSGWPFAAIWTADFEFNVSPGERPNPLCLVARELRSGRRVRCWLDGVSRPCPIDTGPDALFVAHYASAEIGCFIRLGWPVPQRIIDTYAEFRTLTNGIPSMDRSASLLNAAIKLGLPTIEAAHKTDMRDLAIRGGPYSAGEQSALMNYCETDVVTTERILSRLARDIRLPYALIRGRYMAAAAAIEDRGVPIDTFMLDRLRTHWGTLKDRLIDEIDPNGQVYVGGRFGSDRWVRFLARYGIAWPRLPSGRLQLDEGTFRSAAKRYPEIVGPFHQLRVTLGQMRLNELAVGADGRNRTLLSAFASKTGRNCPSNSRFIFGPSAWIRSLIRPPEGMAVAYIDYAQQELGIAAALSGDDALAEVYRSGDPYMDFAILAGAAPVGSTKATHPAIRAQYKQTMLGVQYGLTEWGLSVGLGVSIDRARELLAQHRRAFPRYWAWSGRVVDSALTGRTLRTVFDWRLRPHPEPNDRSLANWPMQSNGAEMLRLACSMAVDRGLPIIAPVHDAVMVEGPTDQIDQIVADTRETMVEASRIVLGGFEIGTDAEVVRWPDRFVDERGIALWATVCRLVEELDGLA